MKVAQFIGPLALVFAGALFYWGTVDPEGRGYGLPVIFLLLLSMISGFATLKQARSKAIRVIGYACVGIPIALIIYFIVFVVSLGVGSLPQ